MSNLSTDAKLIVDFLNTLHVEKGTDALAETSSWHQWTAARSLPPDPLPAARAARTALRAALRDPDGDLPTDAPAFGDPPADAATFGRPADSPGFGRAPTAPTRGQSAAAPNSGQPAAVPTFGRPAGSPGLGWPSASAGASFPALPDEDVGSSALDALHLSVTDPEHMPFPFAALVRIEVRPGGPELIAASAVAEVLAAATRLTVLGEWPRLKICPADDCRWVFYDQSRNRSRTWCSMRICGNREKARAWRERSSQ